MQYIETHKFQHNKLGNAVCGDSVFIRRDKNKTVVAVLDGIGSGVKANICANLFGEELLRFLEKDYSLLESCRLVVESIKIGKKIDNFAAFTALTVTHTGGHTQIVTYEGPQPVFVNGDFAYVLPPHVHRAGSENLLESNCILGPDRALLVFSDGVSQSGMGHGFGYGIDSQGVANKLNELMPVYPRYEKAAEKMLEYCRLISADRWEDDTSLVVIQTRKAVTANILTGAPSQKKLDAQVIEEFGKALGFKIVCGSTTLDIYCRHTGAKAELVQNFSPFEAPSYTVDGLDFSSEGALMLNQLYNIYELNPKNMDPNAPLTKLKELIDISDKICFYVGRSENTAQNESMMFSQLRIFPRPVIVKMLGEKLRELGKVITVKNY